MDPRRASRATLLLTATIQAANVIYCERRDPSTRLRDYLFAFRFWLGESTVDRIVFVENSGSDLTRFHELADRQRKRGKQVELLSFTQPPFDPTLGKSYGEAKIIEHALENSRLIGDDTFVVKGTGRYYATNFFRVWPQVEAQGLPFVLANFYRFPQECDSRYFGASPQFFREYFLQAARQIDDSRGFYLEHALAAAVNSAVADGKSWRPFPGGGLLVDGVQASTNTSYVYPRSKRLAYRAIASLRNGVPFHFGLAAPERRSDGN